MNRRESLKTLAVGTLAAGLVLEACKEKAEVPGGKTVAKGLKDIMNLFLKLILLKMKWAP
jgi:hypothetical protein